MIGPVIFPRKCLRARARGLVVKAFELRWLAPTWFLNVCGQHCVILADLVEGQNSDRNGALLSSAASPEAFENLLDRLDSVGSEV